MSKNIRHLILAAAILGCLVCFLPGLAAVPLKPEELKISILSARDLNGTAGDYVTVSCQVANQTSQPVNDVTTYLSMVDTESKLPVDLEDWSAEKGLYIGTIDTGQVFPLNWKIHFVKAGTYTLTVIAIIAGQDKPLTSTLTRFAVKPKRNLNPGKVLPVAFGMPIFLLMAMALVQYQRKSRISP